MPARRKASSKLTDSTAHLGFEAKLWLAAEYTQHGKGSVGVPPARSMIECGQDGRAPLRIEHVLANGPAPAGSSNQSGEGEIRKAIIEADLVDCMVALPGQLFYSTQIPVCLWFLARNKNDGKRRDRCGETLFIDSRKMGTVVSRAPFYFLNN